MEENKAELSITVGVGPEDNETLTVRCSGSPNQVLGFIERARHVLGGIKEKVFAQIDTDPHEDDA